MSKIENNKNSDIPNLMQVLGFIAVKDLTSLKDKVIVLDRLGYNNQQIAAICDTTEGTVSKEKSLNKKSKSK
jgi:DNA-binding NarL/FixJ family response regulator